MPPAWTRWKPATGRRRARGRIGASAPPRAPMIRAAPACAEPSRRPPEMSKARSGTTGAASGTRRTEGAPESAAEALSRLQEGLEIPGPVADLARLHLQLGRYTEAERAFRRLRALDPDNQLLAQHGMTWCRIKKGDWRGALESALTATR